MKLFHVWRQEIIGETITKWLLWKGALTPKSLSPFSRLLLLFSGLTVTQNFLSLLYRSWKQPLFLSLFPQECDAFSSEDKLLQSRESAATVLHVKVWKTGRKVAQRQLLPHLCCSSPINPLFSPKPSSLFYSLSLSLISFFSLSSHFFCLYCLTPAIVWEQIDKNETFFRGRMLNMPEWYKKWKRELKEEGCSWNIEGDCCSSL